MSGNRIIQQFHAVFGIFMVMFYIGAGILLLFFAERFNIDKALRVIIGSSFLFYGLYRVYATWKLITSAFFSKDHDVE